MGGGMVGCGLLTTLVVNLQGNAAAFPCFKPRPGTYWGRHAGACPRFTFAELADMMNKPGFVYLGFRNLKFKTFCLY